MDARRRAQGVEGAALHAMAGALVAVDNRQVHCTAHWPMVRDRGAKAVPVSAPRKRHAQPRYGDCVSWSTIDVQGDHAGHKG